MILRIWQQLLPDISTTQTKRKDRKQFDCGKDSGKTAWKADMLTISTLSPYCKIIQKRELYLLSYLAESKHILGFTLIKYKSHDNHFREVK